MKVSELKEILNSTPEDYEVEAFVCIYNEDVISTVKSYGIIGNTIELICKII